MLDMEQIAYDMLAGADIGARIQAGFTAEFLNGEDSVCITQTDNSSHTAASGERDRIIRVGVQLQTACKTPERRNELDGLIDTEMSALCLSRGSPNHFTDTAHDGTAIFRSVLQYNGKYDTTLHLFYMK